MLNPIKEIHKFQHDAGLVKAIDPQLEASMVIEEALELYGAPGPKQAARDFIESFPDLIDNKEVDQFDAALDIIVIAIGTLAKLNLSPQQIQQGLLVVNKANRQKLNQPTDSLGKLTKPVDFIPPEPELQLILDKRK